MVDNSVIAVQSTEGAAQSAIQYFENMRNFLAAVKEMKLLTFDASDLEKVWLIFQFLHLLLIMHVTTYYFKYMTNTFHCLFLKERESVCVCVLY